jgi:O-antigen/teichoic acid export membrane protein
MNVTNTLVRNMSANWIGYAVQVATTFLLTPFILHTLGDARYGAWALLMGLTGYYGLFDLGFRAGLTQFLARHLANKDYEKLNETASTGVLTLGLLGSLLLIVSAVLCWGAPLVFNFPSELVGDVRLAILLVGGSVAIQFPCFAFSAVLTATQRYDIANVIGISTRLLTAGLTVVLLNAGYGLVGVCVAKVVGDLLDYAARWHVAYRLLPQLHVSFGRANLASWWEFTHFGIWNVLITNSKRLISYSDAIVIGLYLPTAAISPFVLAGSVVHYFHRLIKPMTTVLFPAVVTLDAEGDTKTLRKLYLTGSRLLLSLGIAAATIGGFWADDFFRLWIGTAHVDEPEFASVSVLFRILMAAAVFSATQRVGVQLLLGIRRLKTLASLFFLEAILNVVLSIVLLHMYGLIGVAVGTLVPALLCEAILAPIVICRQYGIAPTTYLTSVYVRPLVFAAALVTTCFALREAVPAVQSWLQLLAIGIASMFAAALFMIALAFKASERQHLVVKPLSQVRAALTRRLAKVTS